MEEIIEKIDDPSQTTWSLSDTISQRVHDDESSLTVSLEDKPTQQKYPMFIKVSLSLIGIIAATYILFILRDILIPFALASLFAILLNPLSKKLEKKMPRPVAIFVSLMIGVIIIWWIAAFLGAQFSMFTDNFHAIQERLLKVTENIQQFISNTLNISLEKQQEFINDLWSQWSIITSTLGWLTGILWIVLLLPLYIFLLLYYKPLLVEFLFGLFSENKKLKVAEILEETKWAIQSYISWMLIESVIVATLNTLLLLALWVKYAILLWVVWWILNTIPYVWWIVATLLPMWSALMTSDGYTIQIWIVLWYTVIQFIDNNILVPRIVSSKLEINALFSILFVLWWNALWWVSWMFLAIPFIWVLKIILDRIEEWKPWWKLLWTEIPSKSIGEQWQKRWKYIMRRSEKEWELNDEAQKQ